jgi:putative endonuclease
MDYYLYIIKSLKTGKIYKGQTNNIDRRLHEHTLDRYGPFELLFVQICASRSESMSLEKFFKTGQGREIIHSLFIQGSIV